MPLSFELGRLGIKNSFSGISLKIWGICRASPTDDPDNKIPNKDVQIAILMQRLESFVPLRASPFVLTFDFQPEAALNSGCDVYEDSLSEVRKRTHWID